MHDYLFKMNANYPHYFNNWMPNKYLGAAYFRDEKYYN